MGANETSLDIAFPMNGVDTANGYGSQRPNTSPEAVNVRSLDPFADRYRGGSRHGLEKYPAQQIPEGSELIQHLNQLIVLTEEYLLTSFEYYSPDYIPDVSTNNNGTRNPPGRMVPPFGSGVAPSRLVPVLIRRRVQGIATPQMQYNGNAATIAGTLTDLPSAAGLSGLVTLRTIPRGRDGDGDTVTTNGSGAGSFSVNEASYTGQVTYVLFHEYTDSITGRQRTVTGYTKVNWKARSSLQFECEQGYVMYVGGGPIGPDVPLTYTSENVLGTVFGGVYGGAAPINFIATLTNPADGSPIVGRSITIASETWDPDSAGGSGPVPIGFPFPYTGVTDSNGQYIVSLTSSFAPMTATGQSYRLTATSTVNGETITATVVIQTIFNFIDFPPITGVRVFYYKSPPPEPGS